MVFVDEAVEDATTFDAVNGIAGDSWTWCFEPEAGGVAVPGCSA